MGALGGPAEIGVPGAALVPHLGVHVVAGEVVDRHGELAADDPAWKATRLLKGLRGGLPNLFRGLANSVPGAFVGIEDPGSGGRYYRSGRRSGNPLNLIRAVRLLERAGASALQIEDQIFPKRCGHFDGKAVIPPGDMVMKIKAAVDTRVSPDLLIIARTDARAVEGLAGAIERAQAYAEAGADVTFVEAPGTVEEMRSIPALVPAPQVANMVVGGRTPLLPASTLREMGFSLVLYANAALQASVHAMREVLGALREDGSVARVSDRLASFELRQQTVKKAAWDRLDAKYGRDV